MPEGQQHGFEPNHHMKIRTYLERGASYSRSPKRLTSNQQFLVKEKLLLASGNDKCTVVAVVAI